ncbi:YpdA family putative bacillithiol disulfide reductase [Cesiribacter andamanensis]|uniref:Ferredoxin--NADP reductase n=1 Tax=Cesiribacter andamanensis AMV16 TaxID=1279009 RepID=M7N0V8_9BACT|nr:YpdA family putative bacillithiol disulfide reductase [Cesiribacter andamanensis]EMR00947.1 Ferredoxin--NADP reductase [Cesiribacter andamanensis AMV16]
MNHPLYDLVIIGAGPCGLACGIEAQKRGLSFLILEKGNVVEAIRRYPINMKFFSTAENIEIGQLPLLSQEIRPTRLEALKYYQRVALHYQLPVVRFTTVEGVHKQGDGTFRLTTNGQDYRARFVIIATGYYDLPRLLQIPGEGLPHVFHYYDEAFAYSGTRCLVVGGANSAIEVALDLYRNHAQVSLVHQFEGLDQGVKYWIKPDMENRIKKGEIKAYFSSRLTAIEAGSVSLRHLPSGREEVLAADFVFLMTGYRPDADFLSRAGVSLQGEAFIPLLNPQTYESTVPGLYLAGSIIGGEETAKVFIENGRLHSLPILEDIAARLKG